MALIVVVHFKIAEFKREISITTCPVLRNAKVLFSFSMNVTT